MADEELYEADARDWLDGVDVPPPRLEVAQIVQIGRSQVRRRRLLVAGGTVAALAALAAIPATVPLLPSGGASEVGSAPLPVLDCEVTALPLPDGMPEPDVDVTRGVSISAMDPSGRYIVGSVAEVGTDTEAPGTRESGGTIVWEDGVPTYLPELRHPRDVNTDGVIVGQDSVYRDGNVEDLRVPEGYDRVVASSINDAGVVAGNAFGEDSDVWRTAVVVWPASALDQPQVLAQAEEGQTDGERTDAVAVTDDGAVVGTLNSGGLSGGLSDDRPYLWGADGQRRELPLPPGAVGALVTVARGEWVAGLAVVEVPAAEPTRVPSPSASADPTSADALATEVQRFEPARWNLRTGTAELIDSVGNNGLAQVGDVNRAGDLLLAMPGMLNDPEDPGRSILVRGEDRFALPAPDGQYYMAQAISDDGTVIAGAGTTPLPEGEILLAGGVVAWRC